MNKVIIWGIIVLSFLALFVTGLYVYEPFRDQDVDAITRAAEPIEQEQQEEVEVDDAEEGFEFSYEGSSFFYDKEWEEWYIWEEGDWWYINNPPEQVLEALQRAE